MQTEIRSAFTDWRSAFIIRRLNGKINNSWALQAYGARTAPTPNAEPQTLNAERTFVTQLLN
ncbi:MAG TPA: hypothetical protein VK673_04205 [Chthoniobacterales bacterium]|nr:hypothetical protein [Chthoniobacterales bacterium]